MKVQTTIETKLKDAFEPVHLTVVNESGKHNVPAGSESHFKVLMVSHRFEGRAQVARHRFVNNILKDELAGPVHALSLKLLTPEQWEASGRSVEVKTPPCAHR